MTGFWDRIKKLIKKDDDVSEGYIDQLIRDEDIVEVCKRAKRRFIGRDKK